jgi:hypothetical protein
VILRAVIVGGALLLGGTLLHAAYASAISSAAFGIVLLWVTARQFHACWSFRVQGLLPWTACTAWLGVIEVLRRSVSSEGSPGAMGIFLSGVLFLVGSFLFFVTLGRRPAADLVTASAVSAEP